MQHLYSANVLKRVCSKVELYCTRESKELSNKQTKINN